MESVFGDAKRVLAQLGDLLDLHPAGWPKLRIVAAWAAGGTEFFDTINLIRARAADE